MFDHWTNVQRNIVATATKFPIVGTDTNSAQIAAEKKKKNFVVRSKFIRNIAEWFCRLFLFFLPTKTIVNTHCCMTGLQSLLKSMYFHIASVSFFCLSSFLFFYCCRHKKAKILNVDYATPPALFLFDPGLQIPLCVDPLVCPCPPRFFRTWRRPRR